MELIADYDKHGVFVYQAYKESTAAVAVARQNFSENVGFSLSRMTWIKFTLGWMLHRSGYASKPGQERILRIKISHDALSEIIKRGRCSSVPGCRNSQAVFQWDPDRDVWDRRLQRRAIQIGIRGDLARLYAEEKGFILHIEDVTDLAKSIRSAILKKEALPPLPEEILYKLSQNQRAKLGIDENFKVSEASAAEDGEEDVGETIEHDEKVEDGKKAKIEESAQIKSENRE